MELKIDNLKLELKSEGINKYRVLTSCQLPDGDYIYLLLKKLGKNWILSDEGHTLMSISFKNNITLNNKGSIAQKIKNLCRDFKIKEKKGIFYSLYNNNENFKNVFYNFIEFLIQVYELTK